MRRQRRSTVWSLSAVSMGGLSLLLASWNEWLALGILWVSIPPLWWAFIAPTRCGVETKTGKACSNRSYGRLRGCHLVKHKETRGAALWGMFKSRNPADARASGRGQFGARCVAPSAGRLAAAAARLLPASERARYAEEFRSELWEIAQADSRRAQLAYAARQLVAARRLRAGLQVPRRRGAVS
jgi:hypothetical protein